MKRYFLDGSLVDETYLIAEAQLASKHKAIFTIEDAIPWLRSGYRHVFCDDGCGWNVLA